MTGKSQRGVRGFVHAGGAPLDAEVHLRINGGVLASLAALRQPLESTPDVIRRALNEHLERETKKGHEHLNRQ